MRTLFGALLVCALTAASCGSDYTIVDTSQLDVSANARVTAQTLLPTPEKYPALVQKLALAEEVYADQLHLLKQRADQVCLTCHDK